MKRFKLSTEKSPYWLWVCIFDSVEDLEKHWNSYNDKDFDNALGFFHPYTRERLIDGKWVEHKNAGEICLCKKHLGNILTSHELLHAAIWLWRKEHGSLSLGEQVNQEEEEFCYLYGELFAEFIHKMYKTGLY